MALNVKERAPEYKPIKTNKNEANINSYFDGKLGVLIGYRALWIIVTICTLTLASAWIERLIIKYKIEHTVYSGKRLKFKGKGIGLFVLKFRWIVLTILTLGIYAFCIPLKKQRWITSKTYFEDETFIKNDSYFNGTLLSLILINLYCKLITLLSLGILYPFGICYKQRWIAKHTIINRKKIIFEGKASKLIDNYLLWWFFTVITLGIYGIFVPIKFYKWNTSNTHIMLIDENEKRTSIWPMLVGILLTIALITCLATATYNHFKGYDFDELANEISDKVSGKVGKIIIEKIKANISDDENNKIIVKPPIEELQDDNKEEAVEEKKVIENDYYRNTSVVVVDGILAYGYSDHSADLKADIIDGNISLSQHGGAVIIKNTNAKYLYSVNKNDKSKLYYITNNYELFVVEEPNAGNDNQTASKVIDSRVVEFLGTKDEKNNTYLRVLLENGEEEDILIK